MTITAKIIADSITHAGARLTTMQLRYPRFIHAEELTHRLLSSGTEIVLPDGLMYDRDLSRNASSSRAVPVPRLIQDVLDDTAMPIHWGKNQPGMQAREEHDAEVVIGFGSDDFVYGTPVEAWCKARDKAITMAKAFHDAGYHKQVVNRLLEPFSHINVIVSATEWDNFFQLRLHPDAQPEIHQLAQRMLAAMEDSEPRRLGTGEWHLPYLKTEDRIGRTLQEQIQISGARCARVSYWTHDGKETDPAADMALAADLWNSGHYSPFEHQATPLSGQHGNFKDWIQARHVGHYAEEP